MGAQGQPGQPGQPNQFANMGQGQGMGSQPFGGGRPYAQNQMMGQVYRPPQAPQYGAGGWGAATQPGQGKGGQSPGAAPPGAVKGGLERAPFRPGGDPYGGDDVREPFRPGGDPSVAPQSPGMMGINAPGAQYGGLTGSATGAPSALAPVRNERERVARYYDDGQIQRNFDTLFAQDPNMAMAYTEADPRTQQWRMRNQDAIMQRFGPREADGGSPLGYRQWVNHNLAGNDIGLWRSNPQQWADMRRLHGFTSDPNNAGLGPPEWQVGAR